jgi:hypothetical protein
VIGLVSDPFGLSARPSLSLPTPASVQNAGSPASILFTGALQSELERRNVRGLEYAFSNPVFEQEVADLLMKVSIAVSAGPSQPMAVTILEWQLRFRDLWRANAEFNNGNYFVGLNDATRVVLEAFVEIFGDALGPAQILTDYPLDVAKIAAAFGTAYTYGFIWGQ